MTLLGFAISLDGTDITDRVTGTEILYQRSAIHNQITVTSADPTLWPLLVDHEPSATQPETVTLDRYSWYTFSGWSLYATNRWRTFISEEPTTLRFDMVAGTKESTYEGLNAAREWWWSSSTEYLYVYATSDPDTLYTNPGIQDGVYLGQVTYVVEHPDGAWTLYGGQANTWYATYDKAPDVVFFDTTEGIEKTSIAALTKARNWYYDAAAERVYCYATSNPGTLYSEVDILTEYTEGSTIEILKKEIDVTLGTDTLRFYLEYRAGSEYSFTFGGRSISAAEEKEIIGEYYTELSAQASAETVAAGMLVNRTLTWDADACTLPAGFNFHGAPARGVDQIAQAIGLVARADDDGNFVVAPHIPGMYPPYGETSYPSGTADFTLDAEDDIVDSAAYAETVGTRHNAVVVRSPFTPPEVIMLAGTPIDQYQYQFYVRLACLHTVYNDPTTRPTFFYSHGTASYSTTSPYVAETITLTEEVLFRNGQGSVGWPIKSVLAVGWNGAARSGGNVGTITYTAGQRTVQMASGHAGKASIEYTCEVIYIKCVNTSNTPFYQLSNDPASVVVGVNFPDATGAVQYQIGAGDLPADEIEDSTLYSSAAKSMRGRAVLRAAAARKSMTVETPMTQRIRDGMIVQIDDPIFGLSGQFWVESATMIIEGVVKKYRLELCQCHP